MHKGTCLCGAVRVEVEGDLAPANACHCTQCRRQSGHYWAASDVPRERVRVEGADNVTWYMASETVRRGFCATCGSFLFWDPLEGSKIAVAMGLFEAPTGTRIGRHIFVADKGDYYEIADGAPQTARQDPAGIS